MKVLIVYDSTYGNTEKIAKSIGEAIQGEVRVLRASETDSAAMGQPDLLIVGSPTMGGRPSPHVQDFLDKVPASVVSGVKVAGFDTRLSGRFARIFGYASEKISASLEAKGGKPVTSPAGFLVKGKKGPLADGEMDRAAHWASEVSK